MANSVLCPLLVKSGTRAGLSLVILVWKALTVRQRPSRSPLWLQQPGSSLQVCCLQGLFRIVAVLSAASPQHKLMTGWDSMGCCASGP